VFQQNNGIDNWKPSYGVYFNLADNKNFIYYADIDNGLLSGSLPYDASAVCSSNIKCLDQININKSYFISGLNVSTSCGGSMAANILYITFTRPDSKASILSSPAAPCPVSYVVINLSSPNAANATVTIYPSGRIQIK
jgi:hypothetical protein